VVLAGARVANGRVAFGIPCPFSLHPGFRTPGKVEFGTRLLTDAEIDASAEPSTDSGTRSVSSGRAPPGTGRVPSSRDEPASGVLLESPPV
jgi:hypothetical protein